jgi:hypothetical protein
MPSSSSQKVKISQDEYLNDDNYDEQAYTFRKNARNRMYMKKLCNFVFVALGIWIIVAATSEKVAESVDDNRSNVQATTISFLNLVVGSFPFKLIALSLHHALQRIDDKFADVILGMHDDFAVLARDRVKFIALLWILLYQLVYAARLLSRMSFGDNDSIISESFIYLNVVFVLQGSEILIYVAYIYDHEHSYILDPEKRYTERKCCPGRNSFKVCSMYTFLFNKKNAYCLCCKENHRLGRLGRRKLKEDYLLVEKQIDAITGQPGWRSNKAMLAKAQVLFDCANYFKKRLVESKLRILKEEENLIGTHLLLTRLKLREVQIAEWETNYIDYKFDSTKMTKRKQFIKSLEKRLKKEPGTDPPIVGRLNVLIKQRKRWLKEVDGIRKQYPKRFGTWNKKVKAIKNEIKKIKALIQVQQEKRIKNKEKKKSVQEMQLRKKLKDMVGLRVKYTSQIDEMTNQIMPIAYENYLKNLEEKQRSVNRNLIPINLAIKKYKSEYRKLCSYRLKKTKDFVKNNLEVRYEKRIDASARDLKKRVPSVPKTAPIISAPEKTYVYPHSTCISVSWKAIPEGNITGYTIVGFMLMPDGKYTSNKIEYKSKLNLTLDPTKDGYYADIIDGLTPNSMYKFRVRGHNEAGIGLLGPASNTLRTAIDEPDQVKTVSAANVTDDTIELQWITPKTHGIVISGYQIKYKTVKEQNWTIWPETVPAPLNATVNNLVLTGLIPGTKYMVQVNTETSVGQNEGEIVRKGFQTTGKKRRRSSFGSSNRSFNRKHSLKSPSNKKLLGKSPSESNSKFVSSGKLLNRSQSNKSQSGKSVSGRNIRGQIKKKLSRGNTDIESLKEKPVSKRNLAKGKSHQERSTSNVNTKKTFFSNFNLNRSKKQEEKGPAIPKAVKMQMASRAAAAKNNKLKRTNEDRDDKNDDIV